MFSLLLSNSFLPPSTLSHSLHFFFHEIIWRWTLQLGIFKEWKREKKNWEDFPPIKVASYPFTLEWKIHFGFSLEEDFLRRVGVSKNHHSVKSWSVLRCTQKLISKRYFLQCDNISYYYWKHLQHKSNAWHNFVTQDVFDHSSSSYSSCLPIVIPFELYGIELSGF